jgi:hypothetical protein
MEGDWTEVGPRSFRSRLTANGCYAYPSTGGLLSRSGRQKVSLPPDKSGGFPHRLKSSNSPTSDENGTSTSPGAAG